MSSRGVSGIRFGVFVRGRVEHGLDLFALWSSYWRACDGGGRLLRWSEDRKVRVVQLMNSNLGS